ncbi:Hypothetical protein A7982_09343 [Minicystis rosea]|nr:Hypothetical protein A7982_09343 [Minicystis rosea]
MTLRAGRGGRDRVHRAAVIASRRAPKARAFAHVFRTGSRSRPAPVQRG